VKKYNIILCDPPWKYEDGRNTPTKNNPSGAGGASKHYPTLSLDEIKAFPVPEITDTSCMLLMWCTGPKMDWGIEILKYWGFHFCTIPFVWIKIKHNSNEIRLDGIGSYTLNNAEYVLLGRKGKYWRKSTKVKQIIFSQKMKHSEKPEELKRRIVDLFGDVPRIELFCRRKTKGWDVWGNEVVSDIILGEESSEEGKDKSFDIIKELE
jgi:N6-adenosine-specific RNA methylase IME4